MIIRIVDVETCGLPPDNAQVVEIATVDLVEGPSSSAAPGTMLWNRGRMWSSFVNPGRPIPPEASAVHHITDEMVADAPTIDAVKEHVHLLDAPNLAAPDYFAAHEARFEKTCLPWLTQDPAKWICTRKCAMTLWPDAPNHKNQTLRYWLGLKLADASLAQPHRALGDAYVTAAILRRLLSVSKAPVDYLAEISSNPILLPRLTFGEHAMKPIAEVPNSYFEWIAFKSKGPWDEDVLHTAKQQIAARRT